MASSAPAVLRARVRSGLSLFGQRDFSPIIDLSRLQRALDTPNCRLVETGRASNAVCLVFGGVEQVEIREVSFCNAVTSRAGRPDCAYGPAKLAGPFVLGSGSGLAVAGFELLL
jgi:hypothetical protein